MQVDRVEGLVVHNVWSSGVPFLPGGRNRTPTALHSGSEHGRF